MSAFRGSTASSSPRSNDVLYNVQKFFSTLDQKLEKPVQAHLRTVYATLAIGLLSAAIGASVHLFTDLLHANFLTGILSMVLLFALYATPHTEANHTTRFVYFLGFTSLAGLGTGPLLDFAIHLNPSIIFTAFLVTAVVFASFSLAALLSPDTKFLHLGGILISTLSVLLIAAIFSRSALVHWAILWLGLAVSCGLVLYDTQLIVEKRRNGDTDYLWHTVDLFVDFMAIFRRILIILADKEQSKSKKR